MKLFHATKIENVPSILNDGLKCSLDGVYLSDTIEGAARWKAGFVKKSLTVAVVEVEINRRKIRKGEDHSPLMQKRYGAGKSFLSHKSIPANRLKESISAPLQSTSGSDPFQRHGQSPSKLKNFREYVDNANFGFCAGVAQPMSYLVMENNSMNDKKHPELAKSDIIKHLPKVCGDEKAAVEFFERQRWGDSPLCPHCQSANVYKMTGRTGGRNKRYLWRCRACGEQYTVRTGAIYEDSKLPLRHWAYGFWRVCASKKGVSAREIERNCQITHKSALFLMHRIRFALTEDQANRQKLGNTTGICEVDETFVGGKPRPGDPRTVLPGYRKNSNKVPVVAVVERGGHVRIKVVPNVTQNNVGHFLFENIENGTIVNTDQSRVYHTILYPITKHLGGRHDIVNHSKQKYTERNEDGTTSGVNCAESFFSLIKRGLLGTFHAVSKEHLHRYCDEFAFRWDTRKLNDGQRVVEAVKRTEGKRLTYDQCVCRG